MVYVLAFAVVAILIGWTVLPSSEEPSAAVQLPAPSGPAVSPRPHAVRAPHAERARTAVDGGEGEASHTWPEWATDDFGQVVLVAPHPSEMPCGTADCLLDDPERHRAATQSLLAHEALDRLLAQQGLDGAVADDLRAQMEANLAAMGWE